MSKKEKKQILGREPDAIDELIIRVGSIGSLVFHTIIFIVFFVMSIMGFISWSLMLLILTTVVSLEAIYLAIFIQMTVNRHTKSLLEVEQDIDEIEEDIDELQEDVEEMTEDEEKDAIRKEKQSVALEMLTKDVRRVLADLEALKNRSQ